MAEAEMNLQDDWDDVRPPDSERRSSVRPGSIRPNWNPPDIDRLKEWVAGVGMGPKPIVLVEGPTPSHRSIVYRLVKTVQDQAADKWVEQGIVENLTERLSHVRAAGSITPHEWDLLWNLLTLESVVVEGSVRLLVDQGHLFTKAFRAIWEARFRLDEGREIKTFVTALSRWMTAAPLDATQRKLLGELGIERELETTYERLDMLFFLVAVAAQNDLVHNLVFVLDGLDRAVTQGMSRKKVLFKELYDFTIAAERWSRLGAPVGFMLGYSGEHRPLEAIAKSNARLGSRLATYVLV